MKTGRVADTTLFMVKVRRFVTGINSPAEVRADDRHLGIMLKKALPCSIELATSIGRIDPASLVHAPESRHVLADLNPSGISAISLVV